MSYSVVFVRKNQSRFVVSSAASKSQADGIARAAKEIVSIHADSQSGDSFKVLPSNMTANLPMVDCLQSLVADTILWKKFVI